MDIFREASRRNLQIQTRTGFRSVAEMWNLPLQSKTRLSLDEIGTEYLSRLSQVSDVVSLVTEKPLADEAEQQEVKLVIAILKEIIRTRKEENESLVAQRSKAETRAQIMEALTQKRTDKFTDMDEAALLEALEKLG